MDAGGREVVERRDEEPAAKRVRREQVKLLNSQCLNMFTLSRHCISTSLRPILWTECEETPWVPLLSLNTNDSISFVSPPAGSWRACVAGVSGEAGGGEDGVLRR